MARTSITLLLSCLTLSAMLFGVAQAEVKPTKTYTSFYAGLTKTPGYSGMSMITNKLKLSETFKNGALKYTVFAPSDKAYTALANKLGIDINAMMARSDASFMKLMQQVVYHHIVPAAYNTQQLVAVKTSKTFLTGKDLKYAKNSSGAVVVSAAGTIQGQPSKAQIITANANIKCGAGWAHGINSVLVPMKV